MADVRLSEYVFVPSAFVVMSLSENEKFMFATVLAEFERSESAEFSSVLNVFFVVSYEETRPE